MDRKIRALATLALAITFALSLDVTGVEASTRTSELTLVWFKGRLSLPLHFKTVAREVEGTFANIGIEVNWAPLSLDGLKVIVLPIEPSSWNLPADTMGVYLGDDGLQPAVYIFVRNVLRALSLDARMERIPTHKERHQIGRAMGKVVAHEIIHALTPDCSHESQGIMRPALNSYLLLNEKSHLEPRRIEAIYRGLRKLKGRSTREAVPEVAASAEP
jgi:hypothetical protein